jgi:hypothetical protein
MKHKHLSAHWALLAVTLFILSASASTASTWNSRTVHFKRGRTAASVTVYLHGYRSKATFTLKAKAGQKLSIVTTEGGADVVMVYYPDGKSDGAPGGIEGTVPASGKTKIVVTEHTMAEPWSGKLVLTIRLL